MMEVIYRILNIIAGIAFIITIIGLIRPSLVVRWGEKRNRWRVLLYYGLGLCVVPGLLGEAIMPEEVKVKQEQARRELGRENILERAAREIYREEANREEAKYTTESGTLDRVVERHVHHVFDETVSRGGEQVPTVIEISTGYTANVAYREGRIITIGLARNSLILDSMEFMERVFADPECGEVERVVLRPHYVITNKYGQDSERQIGTMVLTREVAEKINWSNMSKDRFERLLKTEGAFELHHSFNE